MKSLIRSTLALCFCGVAFVANAVPIYQISGLNIDIPKNGTGGDKSNGNGNDQASNFVRLTNVVNGYNSNPLCPPLPQLPAPILAGATDLGSNAVSAGGLLGYDYAVLHYGSGPGGSPGGGVALYYLNGAS
jgi:hypothetical protein